MIGDEIALNFRKVPSSGAVLAEIRPKLDRNSSALSRRCEVKLVAIDPLRCDLEIVKCQRPPRFLESLDRNKHRPNAPLVHFPAGTRRLAALTTGEYVCQNIRVCNEAV